MDFGNALHALKAGHSVRRMTWADGDWLKIEELTEGKDYIVRSKGRSGEDWIDSDDLLATDWEMEIAD